MNHKPPIKTEECVCEVRDSLKDHMEDQNNFKSEPVNKVDTDNLSQTIWKHSVINKVGYAPTSMGVSEEKPYNHPDIRCLICNKQVAECKCKIRHNIVATSLNTEECELFGTIETYQGKDHIGCRKCGSHIVPPLNTEECECKIENKLEQAHVRGNKVLCDTCKKEIIGVEVFKSGLFTSMGVPEGILIDKDDYKEIKKNAKGFDWNKLEECKCANGDEWSPSKCPIHRPTPLNTEDHIAGTVKMEEEKKSIDTSAPSGTVIFETKDSEYHEFKPEENKELEWIKDFNLEFSHVGWIPEHKQHMLDYIKSLLDKQKRETTTTEEGKDEYWGPWEKCNICESSQPKGANYCDGCGRKIKRI